MKRAAKIHSVRDIVKTKAPCVMESGAMLWWRVGSAKERGSLPSSWFCACGRWWGKLGNSRPHVIQLNPLRCKGQSRGGTVIHCRRKDKRISLDKDTQRLTCGGACQHREARAPTVVRLPQGSLLFGGDGFREGPHWWEGWFVLDLGSSSRSPEPC